MDIKKLFSGIAIIIDDKINDEKEEDKISQICKKLEENNIPLLKYESLPDDSVVTQFKNISFILLDWELKETIQIESETPVTGKTEVNVISTLSDNYEDNIQFIKTVKETTFVPIFIFSHLSPDGIIRKLSEEGLYNDDANNYIFVKQKGELISEDDENKIFTEIENWLKKTPSIYVLKEWEQSLNKAKRDLFWTFYEVNHNWPSVLQKTFTDDGSDVNYELGNFIFKNTMARTEPTKFDKEILKLEGEQISKEDIRKVLEAERFIKNDSLPPDIPFTGDLYKKSPKGNKYLLNIRPECDIIRKHNPTLYCLEGSVVNENLINSIKEEDKKNKITFENNGFRKKTVSP